jgi:hypothetical protein
MDVAEAVDGGAALAPEDRGACVASRDGVEKMPEE